MLPELAVKKLRDANKCFFTYAAHNCLCFDRMLIFVALSFDALAIATYMLPELAVKKLRDANKCFFTYAAHNCLCFDRMLIFAMTNTTISDRLILVHCEA